MPPIRRSALTRKISGKEVRAALGEKATLSDLKSYVASRVAKDVGSVITAEGSIVSQLKGSKAIHLSISWG